MNWKIDISTLTNKVPKERVVQIEMKHGLNKERKLGLLASILKKLSAPGWARTTNLSVNSRTR